MRRWFHYFKRTNQYEKINEELRKKLRVQEGREAEPSLAIIDSQSVKRLFDCDQPSEGGEVYYRQRSNRQTQLSGNPG